MRKLLVPTSASAILSNLTAILILYLSMCVCLGKGPFTGAARLLNGAIAVTDAAGRLGVAGLDSGIAAFSLVSSAAVGIVSSGRDVTA